MVTKPETMVTKMICKHYPKNFRWKVDVNPGDVFDLEPYRYQCVKGGVIKKIPKHPNVKTREIYELEIHQGFLCGNHLMFVTGSYYDRRIVRIADFCNDDAMFSRVRRYQAEILDQQLQQQREAMEKMKKWGK